MAERPKRILIEWKSVNLHDVCVSQGHRETKKDYALEERR